MVINLSKYYVTAYLNMNKSINLLQITDCHLLQTPDISYRDNSPEQRLDAVIKSIAEQFLLPDYFTHLILSGDLAHDSVAAVYQRLLTKTQSLAKHAHWLPGNHDDVAVMSGFSQMQQKIILEKNWAIILLDSTSNPNGLGSGELSQEELDFLANSEKLISALEHPTKIEHLFLVLHHPPIAVNSVWQDKIKLANSEVFWEVVDSLANVRAVSFGHLHQVHHIKRGAVELFCTPATAAQFKKRQCTPVLEDSPAHSGPGFRVFCLNDNGQIASQVHTVAM